MKKKEKKYVESWDGEGKIILLGKIYSPLLNTPLLQDTRSSCRQDDPRAVIVNYNTTSTKKKSLKKEIKKDE